MYKPALSALLATLMFAASGELFDFALVLWLPAPKSATGADMAELHLHGSVAVVQAVLKWLALQSGLRLAEAGEFTRRALDNGRLSLPDAEALGDVLQAQSEQQRRSALRRMDGGLSALIEQWQRQVLAWSAQVEFALDFAEDGGEGEANRHGAGEANHREKHSVNCNENHSENQGGNHSANHSEEAVIAGILAELEDWREALARLVVRANSFLARAA